MTNNRAYADSTPVAERHRPSFDPGATCETVGMRDVYKQLRAGVRFDWGLTGARSLADPNGCLVVVDVLSFTTTVSIALSRGMTVLPYRWRDETAATFAAEHDAKLAVGRSEMSSENPWSLSGAALLQAPFTPRLVLPSPNGSTISAASDGMVVAASLRNGAAVARQLLEADYGTPERPIVVVASGEHWSSNDSLRPALEDLLGAGLVLSHLMTAGCSMSPEARVAAASYESVQDVAAAIHGCAGGLELIEDGFPGDVAVASAVGADSVVPALINGTFIDADTSGTLLRVT